MNNILVTGGAGYIGSHTVVELLAAGYNAIIVDNFSNSKPEVLNRIQQITSKQAKFYLADLLDASKINKIFEENAIDAVIHFAGYKAVGESVAFPLKYYHNNIQSTILLCEAMQKYNVKNIVFSSSATVYGAHNQAPMTEDMPIKATNPYGHTKAMIEQILTDLHTADPSMGITILRYFNPVGAHSSGLIGEDPNGTPNNLMPIITQVACNKLPQLKILGADYQTHDGTGVRDYIHVVDLAKGHVQAIVHLKENPGTINTFNLGTGQGHSVFDVINSFHRSTGNAVPFAITARRPGDIGTCYAATTKANTELNWKAEKTIEDMCRDAWNWQKNNPNGYDK